MSSRKLTLKQAKSLLKVDETKVDKYLRFYSDEILYEPSEEFPNREHLTDTERSMLERYRRVFSLFDIGRTDEFIRSVVSKEFEVEWRQARNIVNEAYYIYGVVGEADREGKKRASINYYRTLSNLAFKDKDYEKAGKLWEKADKLEGLFDEYMSGLDPADFRHPTQFVFVDKVNVLQTRQKELDPDD
jgi:hypothetical protein